MKYRKLNKFFKLFFLSVLMMACFIACKNKAVTGKQSEILNNDYDKNGLNKNYDWTGTYELNDKNVLYTLKLHKRSVDGSYEMQLYNNTKNIDLFKSSIFDAKDDSANIYIRFLNNFQTDASALGFKSGDTLFALKRESEKIKSDFKAFLPTQPSSEWVKTTDDY